MRSPTLHDIAAELNELARKHPIGELQAIRERRPGNPLFMVNSKATQEHWAFHWGGRTELQFNIGLDEQLYFRHGVAFSFKDSREYKFNELMAVLQPQVKRFNKFMRLHPRTFGDMELWIWDGKKDELAYESRPGPIPRQFLANHMFVFLGKAQPVHKIDYELVLRDFDRLLPLYRYVRSHGKVRPVSMSIDAQFCFRAGRPRLAQPSRLHVASRAQIQEQLRIELRHQVLQAKLCARLVKLHGRTNVDWECRTADGTKVDVAVRRKSAYWFYEIKVAESARACIREALGQLLEYAFWNDAEKVTRLIVVGEHMLDRNAKAYLCRLEKLFGLQIEYEQVAI